jgi:hypothetical protein
MAQPSSRRYVKRIWRVPVDRGPVHYLAALVLKSLVKHGWPAKVRMLAHDPGFQILHHDLGDELPGDFAEAVSIAVRIMARTYRLDVSEAFGVVTLNRPYRVTTNRTFKEIKT